MKIPTKRQIKERLKTWLFIHRTWQEYEMVKFIADLIGEIFAESLADDELEGRKYVVRSHSNDWLKIGTRDGKRHTFWVSDGFVATTFTKDQADLMAELHDGKVELR